MCRPWLAADDADAVAERDPLIDGEHASAPIESHRAEPRPIEGVQLCFRGGDLHGGKRGYGAAQIGQRRLQRSDLAGLERPPAAESLEAQEDRYRPNGEAG